MSGSGSYRTALKSTSLIGGSSLVNLLIRLVRTKCAAILIGPAGVGLIGIYHSMYGLVGTVVGMGIATSGTRQMAAAHGAGEIKQQALIAETVRRTVWATGSAGLLIMMLGSGWFSRISFGTSAHAVAIAVLGVTVLLENIATGYSCILQGTRRIADLARLAIWGSFSGTLISIPCYYFWGIRGIVPSLVLSSAATTAAARWFVRRVPLERVEATWRESRQQVGALLRFGVPVMLSGFMTILGGYLIRLVLVRRFGLDGVGIWQAAFSLSGILVNFVLSAMGTEYYPRLTAVSSDSRDMTRAVNEQTEIALLLAGPGLAATILFAPLVISIFYSGRFDAAVSILRWSVYGIFGRLITWPLGFIPLAKGRGNLFLGLVVLDNLIYLAAVWLCVGRWGLPGAGIAFMLLYVVYVPLMYGVGRAIADIAWTGSTVVLILALGAMLALIGLVGALANPPVVKLSVNLVLLAALSVFCVRRLSTRSGIQIRTLARKFHRA